MKGFLQWAFWMVIAGTETIVVYKKLVTIFGNPEVVGLFVGLLQIFPVTVAIIFLAVDLIPTSTAKTSGLAFCIAAAGAIMAAAIYCHIVAAITIGTFLLIVVTMLAKTLPEPKRTVLQTSS